MSNTGATPAEGRTARMERTTSESSVLVEINLDGTGVSDISTSVPFYDHMLTALSKHALIDMTVKATGDTHIDVHHTVEDVAITFGEVLRTALGNKAGIRRFGEATVPLDEALASGRAPAVAQALREAPRQRRGRRRGRGRQARFGEQRRHGLGLGTPVCRGDRGAHRRTRRGQRKSVARRECDARRLGHVRRRTFGSAHVKRRAGRRRRGRASPRRGPRARCRPT